MVGHFELGLASASVPALEQASALLLASASELVPLLVKDNTQDIDLETDKAFDPASAYRIVAWSTVMDTHSAAQALIELPEESGIQEESSVAHVHRDQRLGIVLLAEIGSSGCWSLVDSMQCFSSDCWLAVAWLLKYIQFIVENFFNAVKICNCLLMALLVYEQNCSSADFKYIVFSKWYYYSVLYTFSIEKSPRQTFSI